MKIEPCPHCGGDPTLDLDDDAACVYCGKCQTGGPVCETSRASTSATSAIAAWNRLALAVQIAEAAWLEDAAMEAVDEALADWRDSGDEFDVMDCAKAEKRRLLDAWEGRG